MSNPDKPAWLVPISRVVNHAVQPGTIRLKAGSQAKALEIARSHIQEDGENAPGVEWEPVSEIQDADWPRIDADLDETDVLPVNDTQPALLSSETHTEITVSQECALTVKKVLRLKMVAPLVDDATVAHLRAFLSALENADRVVITPASSDAVN